MAILHIRQLFFEVILTLAAKLYHDIFVYEFNHYFETSDMNFIV